MFKEGSTSALIAFINSLFRTGTNKEYQSLLNDAVDELGQRVPLMSKCYNCEEE